MKIQLWMRGKEGENRVKVYRTISEQQAAQILAVLMSPTALRRNP